MNLSDTKLNVWEERDRLHVQLVDKETEQHTFVEWWDDDARQMFEDGFFKRGKSMHQSVFDYAKEMGMLTHKKNPAKKAAELDSHWARDAKEGAEYDAGPGKFDDVRRALAVVNITIKRVRDTGEYRVNFAGGKEATAYYATDLHDAYNSGLHMARSPKTNPIKGPGKFEGETYAARYAYENADEDLGDSETFGWYGRFSGKIKGRGPFHIIVRENSQGFVYGEFHSTEKVLNKQWRRIEREWEAFYEEEHE